MKHAIAVALTLLIAACATLDSKLESQIGKPVSEAMIKNGAPTQKAEIPTGTVYTWIQRRGHMECWISLTTDKNDVVQSYSYKGCN